MNQDKIYIVIGSFSSWDSQYTRTFRAFYKMEDAQDYVEKANRVLTAMSNHIAEAFNKTDLVFDEDLDSDEMSRALKEYEETDAYKKSLNVWGAHQNLEEFNRCYVEELEIK
jgi:hypothetical protein